MIEPIIPQEQDSRRHAEHCLKGLGSLSLVVWSRCCWSKRTFSMFRNATIYTVMLGILICPLCCGEGKEPTCTASQAARSEGCCGCGHSTNEGGSTPAPCSDGCDHDCVCKGLLEGRAKLLLGSTDLWFPVFGDHHVAVEPSTCPPGSVFEIQTTHPHLTSGRAILVAFGTLLI